MGVTKTKSGRWRARFYLNSNEIHVGQYATRREAESALAKYEAELKKLNTYTMGSFKTPLLKPRKNKTTWLKRIRTWRSERRRDKEVADAIERM